MEKTPSWKHIKTIGSECSKVDKILLKQKLQITKTCSLSNLLALGKHDQILTEIWSLSRNNMDTWEAQTVLDNNPQRAPALILFPSNIVFLGRRLERKCVCFCIVLLSLIALSLNITMASISETLSYSADLLFSQVCCLAAYQLGQELFAVLITNGGMEET